MLQATNIQLAKMQSLRARNIDSQRHAEPDSERARHAERSARHGCRSPFRSSTFRTSRSATSTYRPMSPIMRPPSTSASQVMSTPLRAQGKVALTGDYYADASLDTPVIPLQPLLAAYAPAQASQIQRADRDSCHASRSAEEQRATGSAPQHPDTGRELSRPSAATRSRQRCRSQR